MFIAEIGINHQGDINIAKQLINAAKEAGADVVKFQKRNPDICIPEEQKYIMKNSIFGEMQYIEYKKRLEFDQSSFDEIDRYCKEIGIQWTASIWDIDSLHFLSQYKDIPFIKIPSALLTDIDLLVEINKYKKPVILSNGMSYEKDVEAALQILKDCEVSILCCNSSYPVYDYSDLDLQLISIYKQKYKNCIIGYSGHELGYLPSIVAYSMGAEIIERHITLDKNMIGSDHKASLDLKELKELIAIFKSIDLMQRGSNNHEKIPYESELEARRKLRGK